MGYEEHKEPRKEKWMKEPIIDESKIIIRKPSIYIGGIYCKTNEEQRFHEVVNRFVVICGVVSLLLSVGMILYFHFLQYF